MNNHNEHIEQDKHVNGSNTSEIILLILGKIKNCHFLIFQNFSTIRDFGFLNTQNNPNTQTSLN